MEEILDIFNDKLESLINLTNSLSFNLHNVSTLLENTSSITSCLAANFSFLALSLAPEITLSLLDLASISAFSKISVSSSLAPPFSERKVEGRLCHFPCEVFSRMGGDCYEPIHKNVDFYDRACISTYYKSKIAPTAKLGLS